MPDFTAYDFASYGLDVSRETREKFNTYARLLLKWQKAINLVSETTLEDLPTRHFLDSAQLVKYLPPGPLKLADMGSGAGFPGLVLAMMGAGEVHLIESDVRKATFLREVSRETSTPVKVHDDRVEDITLEGVNVVTARALAPLRDLLIMCTKLTGGEGFTGLFLKGEKAPEEIEKARKKWEFDLEAFSSVTDPAAQILRITNLK